ncbi:Hsk1-interacting molecule 1 [Choanephora cucurbitarum]|uniref:Hsk1-interacting molecule 1 n=1 Tax=Choanephora cucurbitarum TaxID=101091 RepID=A0A1C7MX24_9FUNG|nr:Hsk1-interacting molecule 1 [Choanephora cucurbitarum]
MQKTVDYFVDTQRGRKDPAPEKKALLNALQEEKIFGPSTGANSEAQAKRPQFIPFTGHFLIIEDATQVHRPPVIRQYTKDIITKKPQEYPWPFLKPTVGIRSPFGKRSNYNKKKEEEAKEETAPVMIDEKPTISTTPVVGVNSNTPTGISSTPLVSPQSSQPKVQHPDSYSLRASGFQPCTNTRDHTTQNTITTNTTNVTTRLQENRRLPPGEINRLDKRMVENVVAQKTLHKQAIQGEREEKARKEREKEQKKKKDARYCENCNMLFHHLEEHIKEQTHQTFVRDQNNFKELDAVLEKTHRIYKEPLPDRMRSSVDPHIDGKHVRFQSDHKRPLSTLDSPSKMSTSMMQQKGRLLLNDPEVVSDDKKGWAQYHSVFL